MKRILISAAILGSSVALAACDKDEAAGAQEPVMNTPEKAPAKQPGTDDRYATKSPDDEAVVGQKTKVAFRIEPRGDLKINKEFPWKIEFQAPEGVELGATALDRSAIELTDSAATIPVDLTAAEAGQLKLAATGNFSVCNPQRCDILRDEPLEFSVVAVPAEQNGEAPAVDAPEEDPAKQ